MSERDELDDILDEAEDALDAGDPELALELCDRVLRHVHPVDEQEGGTMGEDLLDLDDIERGHADGDGG